MKDLTRTFLRSLSIQSSWNFRRMQNLGFAYAMIPTIEKLGKDRNAISRMLTRHLQPFNTHPCMSAAIIGSVVKLEENLSGIDDYAEVDALKKTLMAPYAAMGDSLFWGALKPFAAALAVLLALKGFLIAPLALVLVYNAFHFLVRIKGFEEGYRTGKGGIDFIRKLNLPQMSRRIRWMSVVLLGIFSAVVSRGTDAGVFGPHRIIGGVFVFVIILVMYWLIREGISSLKLLYGFSILFILVAMW
ncbi:MAG: PTS system mannose/fructose/sorbose family transporter subunit IID [Syntrophales bacterium]